MRILVCIISIISFFTAHTQQLKAEKQISLALLAAPEAFRDEATVLGYDENGTVTELRKGTNDIICLADDPNKDGFSVAAYHKTLNAYMVRGRELRQEGKTFKESFDIREEEVKSGILFMPDKSTLFVLSGKFDEDGNPVDTYLRYVFYIPFATVESTGLPLAPPSEGGPWIMDPGTHRAHIMINPPNK